MLEIRPLSRLDASVRAPGSKSYTQRAMIIAALAEGRSRLRDALLSEDTERLAEALCALGTAIRTEGRDMIVAGTAGKIVRPPRAIHLGNNGTALRLLAGVASLGEGPFVLTGDNRLCERPLKPLLEALAVLGVKSDTDGGLGYPPVTIMGGGLLGGEVILRDIGSSQYVSSLLIAAPFADADTTIVLEGKIPSLPYVALTTETMEAFGVRVLSNGGGRYVVKSGQRYRGRDYRIEGDVSSASYFFLAAALLKGRVRVENVDPRTLQGDIGFLKILEQLGCEIRREDLHVEVQGGELPGGEMSFDLGAMPDLAPTLAVLCAVRPGRSLIRNIAHLRLKECDRLAALVTELRRTGIGAEELPDGISIAGGKPRGAVIETYNDHRIAMSFAILGLAAPGMRIAGETCVGKSFPGFWTALEGLYG
ncbi:MAG: 3-phosphoshikimate 1-carboxyvinyltransferase [Proteobacteria bacterium]|nr:3-phosphoshikimate 1-carboxyvinyltransferase [Pseudomonadota bacterium]MBU2227175.1 3-phosphoshikimate 1-carboxyvinyltransferase [Pseudomonadota bacterium]MBU2262151.1 3-phosphoshikimate 1-carboxyvinyltransferase [Pseudomonadota bacterium]